MGAYSYDICKHNANLDKTFNFEAAQLLTKKKNPFDGCMRSRMKIVGIKNDSSALAN